jgi:hypothetical protein
MTMIEIEESQIGTLASRRDLKARVVTRQQGVTIDRVVAVAWASITPEGIKWSLYDIVAGGGAIAVHNSLRGAKRALKRLAATYLPQTA